MVSVSDFSSRDIPRRVVSVSVSERNALVSFSVSSHAHPCRAPPILTVAFVMRTKEGDQFVGGATQQRAAHLLGHLRT
jgi:hypothetical protein